MSVSLVVYGILGVLLLFGAARLIHNIKTDKTMEEVQSERIQARKEGKGIFGGLFGGRRKRKNEEKK